MAVPSLNLARLPPPIKVYYPTPKGAAPQAHPGGAHLVHRSWPLPPAPAPKFNPKNPGDAIMWKELNERPKAASKPPNKMSGPQSTRGTGGPFWWGAPTHTKMPPRGHLKSTLPKAIGAELGRAPVPPRSVVFWGTRNQREGRRGGTQLWRALMRVASGRCGRAQRMSSGCPRGTSLRITFTPARAPTFEVAPLW